ncbi:hypothetical protein CRG98_040192 [Punica granatum]|uniref:FAD-binding domain-containing protein n=1 Tax=Punica granatum TaxID=22663 RepID=A0A2I0I604_PUNGR|nr:hypothetical protein CRG98_040192 [Punica granatum]
MASSQSLLFNSIIHSSPLPLLRTRLLIPPTKQRPSDLCLPPYSVPCSFRKRGRKQLQPVVPASLAMAGPAVEVTTSDDSPMRKPRVLVVGGGIGGAGLRPGGKEKGIQSNALATLEAIDMDAAEEVMRAGCITGNRIHGLVDGVSGTWYNKFDMFTPAAERGLPVTRIISRMALQRILAHHVGDDVILLDSKVVDFDDDGSKVTVTLANGRQFEGDLLVGPDGIWSTDAC